MSSIFPAEAPRESDLGEDDPGDGDPGEGDPAAGDDALDSRPEVQAGTLLRRSSDGSGLKDQDDERRNTYRHPVEVCRPIGLQLLNGRRQPDTGWLLADILDLSLGGLCLLITEDTDHPFRPLHRVRLNVAAHPGFGVSALDGELRWFVKSDYVLTLGIGFDQPLASLPNLLPCRRSLRRPWPQG
jgi:hypothetical protein